MHGVEPFVKSYEVLSQSRNSPHFMKTKVHYRIHKSPPPVPIQSHIKQVHAPTSHFLKIQLNIIFPSMPGTYKWSLSLRFPHQNPVCTSPLPHTSYMPCLSHSFQFDRLHNTVRVHTVKLLIT